MQVYRFCHTRFGKKLIAFMKELHAVNGHYRCTCLDQAYSDEFLKQAKPTAAVSLKNHCCETVCCLSHSVQSLLLLVCFVPLGKSLLVQHMCIPQKVCIQGKCLNLCIFVFWSLWSQWTAALWNHWYWIIFAGNSKTLSISHITLSKGSQGYLVHTLIKLMQSSCDLPHHCSRYSWTPGRYH